MAATFVPDPSGACISPPATVCSSGKRNRTVAKQA
jgi:hypothetical protein